MIIILYWLHHLVTSPSYWVHPPVCLVSSGPSVQIETLSQSVSRLECGPLVPPARSMNLCRAELVMARSRSRPRQEMMLTSASVSSYIIGHWTLLLCGLVMNDTCWPCVWGVGWPPRLLQRWTMTCSIMQTPSPGCCCSLCTLTAVACLGYSQPGHPAGLQSGDFCSVSPQPPGRDVTSQPQAQPLCDSLRLSKTWILPRDMIISTGSVTAQLRFWMMITVLPCKEILFMILYLRTSSQLDRVQN